MTRSEIDAFVASQSPNIAKPDLKEKGVMVGGVPWRVLFNTERSRSTRAAVDKESIAARPCFLCPDNRFDWQSPLKWDSYEILVNPYPVLPGHLTIASANHVEQSIMTHLDDIIDLASFLEGYAVFYNGPHSGASAPDHLHFQAVPEHYLNLHRSFPFETLYAAGSADYVSERLREFLAGMQCVDGEYEPRLNMAVKRVADDEYEALVVPRRAHRPSCYDEVHVSPGALDMFGYVVTTSEADLSAVDGQLLECIFSEVAFLREIPMVQVGIVTAPEISFQLHGDFRQDGDTYLPESDDCRFQIDDVTIGIGFHWERRENQRFRGALRLRHNDDSTLTAINILPVEEYLQSVISSEMSAKASLNLLKAHAVISRSWLLAQMRHNAAAESSFECEQTSERIVKWYDHDDHIGFDVCADDHCQRYQGEGRISRPEVFEAVLSTIGEVLVDSYGDLCDARFSKCCGGAFEEFESCWQPVHHDYLEAAPDSTEGTSLPDLTVEENAVSWIKSRPEAFCARPGEDVLKQVLNNYDRETTDFYRWTVAYGADELSELVKKRSGIDFGPIRELIPLKRGTSGRIYELKIVGDKRTMTVGKELEIRKWLSTSHLYSSAFVAEHSPAGGWRLHGAGWGHGVGLCQIGAAVMGARGYDYREILLHYFKNAKIEKAY